MRSAAAALGLALVATTAGAQTARVEQFAWLAGCWGFDTPDGRYEEHWMSPTGNSMLGMSRRVGDGYTKEYEYLRIVTSGGGGFDYIARPKDGEETRFLIDSLVGTRAVFENLQHDFPQRIIYEFIPPDQLKARIEGKQNGKPMGMNFPMKKKACN